MIIGPGRQMQVIHHSTHNSGSRVMISKVVDDGKSESIHVGVSFSLSLLAGGDSCSAEVMGEILSCKLYIAVVS